MKQLFMFCLIFILGSSIYGQTTKFYEKVLSDFKCRNCYFISLDVESQSYSGRVIVENDDLFDYLKLIKGFNEEEYKTFMLKILQENQRLEMNAIAIDESGRFLIGKDLQKNSIRIVETSQTFETVSAQGCKQFIQHYFAPSLMESKKEEKLSCKDILKRNAKDLLMMPRFDLNEQSNVISELFKMHIPVHIDDISGSLRIGHLALD